MVAASAFLTTVLADSIVGGYRGAPNTVGVVWPAVLRNAAAVAILTVAAGGGDGQISVQSVIVFSILVINMLLLRLVRKDTDKETAVKRTGTDAIVIAAAFLMVVPLLVLASALSNGVLGMLKPVVRAVDGGSGQVSIPSIGQMTDNIKVLLALAIIYNQGRRTAGSVLASVGLKNLKPMQLQAVGAAALVLSYVVSQRSRTMNIPGMFIG